MVVSRSEILVHLILGVLSGVDWHPLFQIPNSSPEYNNLLFYPDYYSINLIFHFSYIYRVLKKLSIMSKEDDNIVNVNININVNTENKIVTTTVNGKPYHSANILNSVESNGEKPLDIVSTIKKVRRIILN